MPFTKHDARTLSREFASLAKGSYARLNRSNDNLHYEGAFSPLGWILWRLGCSRIALKFWGDTPFHKFSTGTILLDTSPHYFSHVEQLEFIDTEWRMHHDVGDLVRYPMMLVSGDVW